MHSDTILLAVSGGLDSMVMLHRLLADRGQDRVVVAHCNFLLRGEESDADEAFVKGYCQENGVGCHSRSFSTEEYAGSNKIGIQEAARELRYAWFDELLTEHGYSEVATAHHEEDSVETFLINLLRGTGLDGLCGIAEQHSRKLVRPLLRWSRAQIVAYADEHEVPWREDSSNDSDKYLRNRVRHELLPLMDDLRKGAANNLKKTIDHLRSSRSLMREGMSAILKEVSEQDEGHIYYHLDRLIGVEDQVLLLYEANKAYGFSYTQIEDILRSDRSGARVTSGLHGLYRTADRIVLSPIRENDEREWTITLDSVPSDLPIPLSLSVVDEMSTSDRDDRWTEYFDLDSLHFPLTLRRWRHGDRMTPLGMKGSKLISDLLTDEKWPTYERGEAYLIEDGNEIIWTIGIRRSEASRMWSGRNDLVRMSIGGGDHR